MSELESIPSAVHEPERVNGKFRKGFRGNPGGKPRPTPTALEVQKLAALMMPGVISKLEEVVQRMDPAKPTTAGVKAAEILANRAFGLPVPETERMLFDLAEKPVTVRFNLAETADDQPLLELEAGKEEPEE